MAALTAVVVGGGTMGTGIAYTLWASGYAVDLVEVDRARHASIRATLVDVRSGAVTRGKLDPSSLHPLEESVRILDEIEAARSGPDVAIEAVPEDLDLKRRVLAKIEQISPVLLGTNTSSISINSIAQGLVDPTRLIGVHFFNPVWVNPLVEVVVADRTGDDVVQRTLEFVSRIRKECVVVRDRPGFATSRLGVLLGLEAIRMVEEGVATAADVDRAMELGYRHPMGPLKLTDLVGLDVRLAIARNLEQAYGPRFAPPPLLLEKVASGDLGKKTGRGFYEWPQP